MLKFSLNALIGVRILQTDTCSLSDIYMSFAYTEYPICVTVTAYSGTFVAVNIQQPLVREKRSVIINT